MMENSSSPTASETSVTSRPPLLAIALVASHHSYRSPVPAGMVPTLLALLNVSKAKDYTMIDRGESEHFRVGTFG